MRVSLEALPFLAGERVRACVAATRTAVLVRVLEGSLDRVEGSVKAVGPISVSEVSVLPRVETSSYLLLGLVL